MITYVMVSVLRGTLVLLFLYKKLIAFVVIYNVVTST